VRLDLAIISHLYTIAAKEWGMPLPNPVRTVSLPSVNNARTRRLDADEEARLLAELDKARSRWIKPIVELALETAMRRGELLSLQWENIDLARRVAHLPKRDVDKLESRLSLLQWMVGCNLAFTMAVLWKILS
jgi:integrase